jgi:hypothetical protein
MSDLSPAALAVRKAYYRTYVGLASPAIAAALRAAEEHLFLDPRDKSPLGALFSCSEQLLAIAAELEALPSD